MQITLNGGPFDGRIVEVEDGGHPRLYCGFMGDGYIRIYEKKEDKYVYDRTIKANETNQSSGST